MEKLVCVGTLLAHVFTDGMYSVTAPHAEVTGAGQTYVSEQRVSEQSNEKAQPCK